MSVLGCLLLPATALLATLLRWLFQARGNVYTDVSTRYYVPDPDLGWRVVENGPVSIGLDAIALLFGYGVALLAAVLFLRRWERRGGRRLPAARGLLWAMAALPTLVPAWAFASGSIPESAADRAPSGLVEPPADSIGGGVPGLPAGTYRVVPHDGTSIVARLSAGGEAFDARFARDIEGSWRGAPSDLRQPMSAEISVGTGAVDTGIELRSKHAREEYLQAASFPRIGFRLERLLGAKRESDGVVAYRAEGTVELMGLRHRVAVLGTLRSPDLGARRRLGFSPADPVLVASAHFALKIKETKLAPDAGDFDKDIIPIDVSLVLQREADAK